jgi:hypothetical protein
MAPGCRESTVGLDEKGIGEYIRHQKKLHLEPEQTTLDLD